LSDFDLAGWSTALRGRVDGCLQSRFADAWPPPFQHAVLYPLRTGGKRIRPLFVYGAAAAVGSDIDEDIIAVGAAVELIHTYSLVHDDLPCMDDDAERRGKPAVHIAFGQGPAVLVGDALLTEAFRTLARIDTPAAVRIELVEELAQAAGHIGMIGGQAADIGMGGAVTELDDLIRLHRAKTGALICGAVRLGAIAGGATSDQLAALTTYGRAVGLAFQMSDDVLDADEDAGEDGPPSFVRLLGIDETTARYRALLAEALAALSGLPSTEPLAALARFTVERDH
jgi:geranylgeranyl pyrophosphate synthase